MPCPFCAEEIHPDAAICRCCGSDVKIPDVLLEENTELKQNLAALERELEQLRAEQARRQMRGQPGTTAQDR